MFSEAKSKYGPFSEIDNTHNDFEALPLKLLC
jgi:hypothetical protein